MNLYRELISHIHTMDLNNRLLIFRNSDELSFLNAWMDKQPDVLDRDKNKNNFTFDEQLQNCDKCRNVSNKKPGFGTGKNGILIVLNRPKIFSGSDKDQLKTSSINLLKKMINAIEVSLEECYTTNLIKCESSDTLNRPSIMYNNCENLFVRELKEKSPSIIIVMGNDLPLKKLKNENKDIAWYSIEHPVSLIKTPALKRNAWETLKKIKIK